MRLRGQSEGHMHGRRADRQVCRRAGEHTIPASHCLQALCRKIADVVLQRYISFGPLAKALDYIKIAPAVQLSQHCNQLCNEGRPAQNC